MYSKAAASQLRQAFWTAFGQYMAPVMSAEGEKINWINYKTGIRPIRFTMQATQDKAWIAIMIVATEEGVRQRYYDQLIRLKSLLEEELGEPWQWQPVDTDEYGKVSSSIMRELTGISIYKQEDWPALISFFKPRIVALDAFWNNVKYGFETLD